MNTFSIKGTKSTERQNYHAVNDFQSLASLLNSISVEMISQICILDRERELRANPLKPAKLL